MILEATDVQEHVGLDDEKDEVEGGGDLDMMQVDEVLGFCAPIPYYWHRRQAFVATTGRQSRICS